MWVTYTVMGMLGSVVSGALWLAAWCLHKKGVAEGWPGYEDCAVPEEAQPAPAAADMDGVPPYEPGQHHNDEQPPNPTG